MFKYYFEQIENIEIYPIISLSIFFIFFVLLIFWVVKADKSYIKKMSELPVEHNSDNTKLNES